MPRCYMVKKSNYRHHDGPSPCSPPEASVAPPCYIPPVVSIAPPNYNPPIVSVSPPCYISSDVASVIAPPPPQYYNQPEISVESPSYIQPEVSVAPPPYIQPEADAAPPPYIQPDISVAPPPYIQPEISVAPLPYIQPEADVAPPPCYIQPEVSGAPPGYIPPAQAGPSEPRAEYAELRSVPLMERSAADTEAAHDLLALAQGVPPLPPPTLVTMLQAPEPTPLVPVYAYTLQPTNIFVLADKGHQPLYTAVQTVTPVHANVGYVEPPVNYINYQGNENAQPDYLTAQFGEQRYRCICGPQPYYGEQAQLEPTQPEPEIESAQPILESAPGEFEPEIESTQLEVESAQRELEPESAQSELEPRFEAPQREPENEPAHLDFEPEHEPMQLELQPEPVPIQTAPPEPQIDPTQLEYEPEIEVGLEVEVPARGKSPGKFTCTECGKRYATSSNLSRHKQTHRSLDSVAAKQCPECGKTYVSMPALSMHVLTHRMGHVCGMCGKLFSRPWLLRGHERSHTGEKPYCCVSCGKSFADRSNLRAHLQTHSPEKLFECPRCHKGFALKSYLNKHQEAACVRADE